MSIDNARAPDDGAIRTALPRADETLAAVAESDDTPDAIAGDGLFDIVSSRRRRETIILLGDHQNGVDQPSMSITAMSRYIAGLDADGPDPTPIERHRAATLLYQCHLPRLEDAGLVSIDRDGDSAWHIEPTDALGRVADAIRAVETECGRIERSIAGSAE